MTIVESVTAGFAELKALLTSKLSLSDDLAKAKTEATELAASITRQEQEIAALKASQAEGAKLLEAKATELSILTAAVASRDAEISSLKASAKSAGQQAAEMLSKAGVPAAQLPASQASGADDLASIRKQMAAETDPRKRGELALRARELRGHGDLFKTAKAA